MTDRARIAAELAEGPVAGALPAADRAEVSAVAEELAARGMRVKVLVLEPGEPIAPWRSLFGELGLDDRVDLLLIYSDRRWEARGLGLSPQEIGQLLDSAEPALQSGTSAGLRTALRDLAAASEALPPAPGFAPAVVGTGTLVAGLLGVLGLAGTGVLGVLGFVLYRRNRLANEAGEELRAAKESVDHAFAELVHAAEGLPAGQAIELQDRAARLKEEVRRAIREPAGSNAVRVGRLRELENGIAALHSEMLQLKAATGLPREAIDAAKSSTARRAPQKETP